MRVTYARVSTQKQTFDLQVDALKQKGCETIYTDIGWDVQPKTLLNWQKPWRKEKLT